MKSIEINAQPGSNYFQSASHRILSWPNELLSLLLLRDHITLHLLDNIIFLSLSLFGAFFSLCTCFESLKGKVGQALGFSGKRAIISSPISLSSFSIVHQLQLQYLMMCSCGVLTNERKKLKWSGTKWNGMEWNKYVEMLQWVDLITDYTECVRVRAVFFRLHTSFVSKSKFTRAFSLHFVWVRASTN